MPLKLTALPDGRIQLEGVGVVDRKSLEWAKEHLNSSSNQWLMELGWDGTIPEPVERDWAERFHCRGPMTTASLGTAYRVSHGASDEFVCYCNSYATSMRLAREHNELLAARKVVEAVRKWAGAKAPSCPMVDALGAYDAEVGGK